MKNQVWIYVLIAIFAGSAGVIYSRTSDRAMPVAMATQSSVVGAQRPDYSLGASDGRVVSATEFDGDVVLVNFWATWCAPCREEMPMLNELQADYQGKGVSIVGIALDDVESARNFAEQLGITYTILVGGADVVAVGMAYGNTSSVLPYTVLVDRQGLVRWVSLGVLEREQLEKEISKLL